MTHGFPVALLLCAAVLLDPAAMSKAKFEVGKRAPDFQVTTADGQKSTLADFKGEVLVLNFWATWCGPCKRELPLLEGYYRAQRPAGLRILAVATEDSLTPSQLRPLAKVLTIPMVKRFKGPDYGEIKMLPTNFVIDRDGILRYADAGGFTQESMAELLGPLLEQTMSVK